MGELDESKAIKILEEFISENPMPGETQKAVEACQKGIDIVGEKFESKEYFVGRISSLLTYPENNVSKKGNKKLTPYLNVKIWDKNESI